MCSGEIKADFAVGKGRIGPSAYLVAEQAIKTRFHLCVQQALAGAEIVEVARCARAVPVDEFTFDMTRDASHLFVAAFKGKELVLCFDCQYLRRAFLLKGAT